MSDVRDYFEEGIMRDMLNRKLITPTTFRFAEVIATYQYILPTAKNKTQAVKITSESCRVCEMTVWRAIKTIH